MRLDGNGEDTGILMEHVVCDLPQEGGRSGWDQTLDERVPFDEELTYSGQGLTCEATNQPSSIWKMDVCAPGISAPNVGQNTMFFAGQRDPSDRSKHEVGTGEVFRVTRLTSDASEVHCGRKKS